MSKIRIIALISLCVAAMIAIAVAVMLTSPVLQINRLIENNEYYEAYKVIQKNDLESKYSSNPGIMFFDVMAHHYEDDLIGGGSWILPDFTGWSCAEIAYALNNIGQAYEIEFVEDSKARSNAVVEHFPKIGEEVTKSDVISIKVNKYSDGDNSFGILFRYNLLTEIGEWIYYAVDNCVFRSRIDGTQSVKIFEDVGENRFVLSVLGKSSNLYCILAETEDTPNGSINPDEICIVSIKLDDYSFEEIAQTGLCVSPKIYGNQLFLFTRDICNLETGEINRFPGEYNYGFIIYGEYEYTIDRDKGAVYRRVLYDDSLREELFKVSGKITNMIITDDYIYFTQVVPYDGLWSKEYLFRYDFKMKTMKKVKKLSNETTTLGDTMLGDWQDQLLLISKFGNSFKYNIDTGKIINIETPSIYLDGDLDLFDSYTVCGNSVFYYTNNDGMLSVSYPRDISQHSYNLMKDELEEFPINRE